MNQLHDLSIRIAELGRKRPSASARRELMEALGSKAEGIRINAAKALGEWGDAESIDTLKGLLSELAGTSDKYSHVSVLTKLLIPHVSKLDRDWVIDLYFRASGSTNRHYLKDLMYAFPLKETASTLAKRYRSGKNKDEIPGLLDAMQFYALMTRRKD